MAVTIRIGEDAQELPDAEASSLAEELRAIGDGYRGDYDAPEVAYAVADEIEDRLDVGDDEPVMLNDPASLEALQRALNAIVREAGPAMQLHHIAVVARRAA